MSGEGVDGHLRGCHWFLSVNTVGLFASLVIILLLTGAITIKRKFMMWVLMIISVFSVAFSFLVGVILVLPGDFYRMPSAFRCFILFRFGCIGLLALLVSPWHLVSSLE